MCKSDEYSGLKVSVSYIHYDLVSFRFVIHFSAVLMFDEIDLIKSKKGEMSTFKQVYYIYMAWILLL